MSRPCWAIACPSTDTKRYLNAFACSEHTPAKMAGHPEPPISDPTRTEKAMRKLATPKWAKGGTDLNKERPGGYVSRQRAEKIASGQTPRQA